MRIVVDENIPAARRAFGSFGDVVMLPGRAITHKVVRDAYALVVRSITRVDAELLQGTNVRFVGTATNGVDHIDRRWLYDNRIGFAHAGGSNARSVAEYVVAALLELRRRGLLDLGSASIGLLGGGEVGRRLARCTAALGMRTVVHDPPRVLRDPSFRTASFADMLNCDVVSIHTPLVAAPPFPTELLFDRSTLAGLRDGTIVINTARGGLLQSDALLDELKSGRLRCGLLDVWQGEPEMPRQLLDRALIATPHVAGYSADAKVLGTALMARGLALYCTATPTYWSPADELAALVAGIDVRAIDDPLDAISVAVFTACDIMRDDTMLRAALGGSDEERRGSFDQLRRNYPIRREFPGYIVDTQDPEVLRMAVELGFMVGVGREQAIG